MRVLLVEDEPKLAAFIRKGLSEESSAVDVAPDGEAALVLARTTEYDVVILDIMLPGMDGFTVCERLRSLQRSVPILMLSARGMIEDRVRGLDAGADDYLTKPFAFTELRARLRALVRRRKSAALLVLTVSDITLDPLRRIVTRADRRVDLTPKEFELLAYFMKNADHVLTRAMIAEEVWHFTWDRLTNVIDVFVNHLRRKLEDAGEPRVIHAVRGVGYVMRAEDAPGA